MIRSLIRLRRLKSDPCARLGTSNTFEASTSPGVSLVALCVDCASCGNVREGGCLAVEAVDDDTNPA